MRLLPTILTIAIVLGPGIAVAQEQREQGAYAFGNLGYGSFVAGGSTYGGWMLGGGVGTTLSRGWFLEGVVDQMANYTSDQSSDAGDVTTAYARIGHRWSAPGARFRPFLAVTVGAARDAYADARGREHQFDSLMVGGSAGVDLKVSPKVFVRPDFGIRVSYGEVFATGGVNLGFRF